MTSILYYSLYLMMPYGVKLPIIVMKFQALGCKMDLGHNLLTTFSSKPSSLFCPGLWTTGKMFKRHSELVSRQDGVPADTAQMHLGFLHQQKWPPNTSDLNSFAILNNEGFRISVSHPIIYCHETGLGP